MDNSSQQAKKACSWLAAMTVVVWPLAAWQMNCCNLEVLFDESKIEDEELCSCVIIKPSN